MRHKVKEKVCREVKMTNGISKCGQLKEPLFIATEKL